MPPRVLGEYPGVGDTHFVKPTWRRPSGERGPGRKDGRGLFWPRQPRCHLAAQQLSSVRGRTMPAARCVRAQLATRVECRKRAMRTTCAWKRSSARWSMPFCPLRPPTTSLQRNSRSPRPSLSHRLIRPRQHESTVPPCRAQPVARLGAVPDLVACRRR